MQDCAMCDAFGLLTEKCHGNHPIFNGLVSWTSRGKFQFHGGCNSADAHVRAFIVVSP
jgi:hypothetical protein